MGKKIDWFNGKNALNDYDMQEICDQIANVDTPQNLAEVIKGSEQVIVDVAEDNKSLEIHLDAETTADISRSLKTPVSAPATTKLVAVDTTNSQEMLTIGNGLTVENGELKASGGGNSFLVKHIISFTSNECTIYAYILSYSITPFTIATLSQYLLQVFSNPAIPYCDVRIFNSDGGTRNIHSIMTNGESVLAVYREATNEDKFFDLSSGFIMDDDLIPVF